METATEYPDRRCEESCLCLCTSLAMSSQMKRWISSAQVASKMILLARTTPLEEVKKPSEGLSLFFIDLDKSAPGLELRKIKKMGGRAVDANEVFFDNYRIPAESLIGDEGQGFKIVGIYPLNPFAGY
jgi:acyl-CoA dehydrogenase